MNWLKYSGIFLTMALNPFHWRLGVETGSDVASGPKTFSLRITLLFLGIHILIDNGDW